MKCIKQILLSLLTISSCQCFGARIDYRFATGSVDRFGYISISKSNSIDPKLALDNPKKSALDLWSQTHRHIRNQSDPSLATWQRYATLAYRAEKLKEAVGELQNRLSSQIKIGFGSIDIDKVSDKDLLVYGYVHSLKELSDYDIHMDWTGFKTPLYHVKLMKTFNSHTFKTREEKLVKLCAMEFFREYPIARSMISNILKEKYEYKLALYQSRLYWYGSESCPPNTALSLSIAQEANKVTAENARGSYLVAVMTEYSNLRKSKEIASEIINSPTLLPWEVKKLNQIIEKKGN